MYRLNQRLGRIYLRMPNLLNFEPLPAQLMPPLTRPTIMLRALGGTDNEPTSADEQRQCWICLATEEELPDAYWLHPCRCRGSNKWVHEFCLSRWIDEKQLGDIDLAVVCTQCRTEYIIIVPPPGRIDAAIDYVDKYYERLCPTIVMGMMLATLYFSAVTYGALTVLQVIGYEEGMQLLSQGYPPLLLIGLPAIPFALLFGRVINWDDAVVHVLRANQRRRYLRRRAEQRRRRDQGVQQGAGAGIGGETSQTGSRIEDDYYDYLEHYDYENSALNAMQPNNNSAERILRASRNFVGALILPTCAVIVGRLLFEPFENPWQRALLGGLTFVLVKGCASIYLRQCNFIRKRDRQVLDYTEQNVRMFQRAQ